MQSIKDTVEKLIEESYLQSLSEKELGNELSGFTRICRNIVRKNVREPMHRRKLLRRIAGLHTAARELEPDIREGEILSIGTNRTKTTLKEKQVRMVSRTKRAMIRAIESSDPRLILLIEKECSQQSFSPLPLRSQGDGDSSFTRSTSRKAWIGLALGVVVVLSLVLIRILF